MTEEQRWTVVIWHKLGRTQGDIAHHLGVDRHTVGRLLVRYRATLKVSSGHRKGRPRCTDEAEDIAMAVTARIEKFTSPRQIRRKLEYGHVSARTIDRRLIEANLPGRIAVHKRAYSQKQEQEWRGADCMHTRVRSSG